MPNMSYCRFENTFDDLKDCQESLDNYGSVKALEEDSNDYEKEYIKKLIILCGEIYENHKHEL